MRKGQRISWCEVTTDFPGMEKDPALGDSCGDGRTRMQLVGADKIVQPSICYMSCNYLELKEQHKKGRETLGWENRARGAAVP